MDNNQQVTKKRSFKWFWILIMLLILALFYIGYNVWQHRSSPTLGGLIISPSTVSDICPCGWSDESAVPYEELGKCVSGSLFLVVPLKEIDSAKKYLGTIPGLTLFRDDFPPRYAYAFELTTDNYDYVKNFSINENLVNGHLTAIPSTKEIYVFPEEQFSAEDIKNYEEKYKVKITDNSNYRLNLRIPKGKESEIYFKIVAEKPTYKIGPVYVSDKFPVMRYGSPSPNKDYCYKYEMKGLNVSF